MYVDKRQIVSNSFNDSKFGNVNVQGDNVKQVNLEISDTEKEKAFSDLYDFINNIEDEGKKNQALYNAEELKLALEEGNDSKAKKLFSFLQSSLGNISALITIGQFAGLPII